MSRGKAFLLKISNHENPPAYLTVAGLRETKSTMRTALDDSSVRFSVEAAGIFLDRDAETKVRTKALSGELEYYELSFEDGTKLRGKFLITRLDYAGDFGGERNYRLNMESVGEVSQS